MLNSIKKMITGEALEIKHINKIVQQVNKLEPEFEMKSDAELKAYTEHFKSLLNEGTELSKFLPEAFAVVREASKRVLGYRHYDVQLMGGVVLTESQIAQMQTGEGKTLVATLPAYAMSLYGKGIHIITANEYLATRDFEQMRPLYEFLGLTTGLNISGMETEEKQEAYSCDITYGTGTEFGFDYLRDHMVQDQSQLVQRPHFFALIDEVDSILIDEARTPLIIAGKSSDSLELFPLMAMVVESFEDGIEYEYYPETKQIVLTDKGADKLEEVFGLQSLYEVEHRELLHVTMQSLRAKVIMKRDVDYIVKEDKIMIVDPYTGRIMEGRTYSDGLHQAIEAKEKVSVKEENSTQASITIQHYFRKYQHLAGMTGSAVPSKNEFWETYSLRVVEIPTNKPNQRIDHGTLVYKTYEQKVKKIVDEVNKYHELGRPVLIGTTSIAQSEKLSDYLNQANIPHSVLNAKTEEDEAKIISEAGQYGKVMLATNMAGRGTDILLGEGVSELGGLHIIGTEIHNSARIDMQLKGRSGRQGDPGSTQFILSLEDEIFKFYDDEEFEKYLSKVKTDETGLVLAPNPLKFVYGVQKVVEGSHFSSREHLLKLDEVNNDQQQIIYSYREKALHSEEIKGLIMTTIEDRFEYLSSVAEEIRNQDNPDSASKKQMILDEIKIVNSLLNHQEPFTFEDGDSIKELVNELERSYQSILDLCKLHEETEQIWTDLQGLYLQTLDRAWVKHLETLHYLREGFSVRGYSQEDPYRQYAFEALEAFTTMLQTFYQENIRYFLQLHKLAEQQEPLD